MPTVTLQQAQDRLSELVRQLKPGEDVVITDNHRPVARLTAAVEQPAPQPVSREPRQPGTLRGTVLYMAPDFNAPLDDFREYME